MTGVHVILQVIDWAFWLYIAGLTAQRKLNRSKKRR